MATQIGLRIGVDGEAEFRKSINNINDSMKTLKSEMAAVTSEYDKNDKSQENLAKQNEVLAKQIELQRRKVEECNDVLAKAIAKEGENTKEIQSWERAVNTATSELNKLERQLSTNNSAIAESNKKVDDFSETTDRAGKKINSAADGFTSAGTKMTVGLTAPIIAAGAVMVDYASDLSENMNKTSVAFGDNAADVTKWSETTLDAYGISQSSALDMASMFGDMGTAMGQSTSQAATMSMSMVGLAGDLASFKNIGIDQAQDALKGIFTGEGEALKSLGIIMQDSTLEAYALATGQEKAYSEMDQAEKVALRYSYVMDATKNSQGDFARTSDGTANSIRTMQESVKELGASFGEELLPTITPVIQSATNLIKQFGALDEQTKKTIITVAGMAAAVGPLSIGIGTTMKAVGTGISTIGTMSGALKVMFAGAEAATPAIAGLSTAITFMTGPVGITIGILAALATGIAVVASSTAKNTEEQKKALQVHDDYIQSNADLLKSITDSADARKDSTLATEGEAAAAKKLADKIFELSEKQNKSAYEMSVLDVWVDQFNGLMPTANMLIDDQTGALNLTKDATYDLINAELQRIQLSAATEALTEITKEQLKIAQQMTQGTIEANDAEETHLANLDKINNSIMTSEQRTAAINFENQQYGKTLGETKSSMEDLTAQQKTLASEYSTYEQFIADPTATQEYIKNAGMTVTNTDGSIKDINTLWAEYTANTPNTTGAAGLASANQFKAGIELGTPGVGAASQTMHDGAKGKTDPLPGEMSATGSESGQSLSDGLSGKIPIAGASAQGIYDAATGKFIPLPGAMTGFGGDSGQGFADGMDSKKGSIEGSSDSIVQKVLKIFKDGFGIASPSKELYSIGSYTMEGFLNSLLDGSVNVMGFIDKMIGEIKDAFAAGNFNLQGAINFVGTGAAEFFKSIGIGGSDFKSLTVPVGGSITSGFGYRDDVGDVGSKYHEGIDIGASEGTPVGAAGAGTVVQAGWNGGYGNSITIDHGNGLETLYGHLSEILVNVGQLVSQLQTIGLVGSTGNSTGPHLHFSVIQNGEMVDPSSIFGFDVGSRYIPYDMPAMVHQGEMIIPKSENPYANSGGSVLPQTVTSQPAVINLMLQNGSKIAEYLIDDINSMLGKKTSLSARGVST